MIQVRCNLRCMVSSLLLFYCLTLTLLVGDIGFQGDDWWIFGFPFWNPLPESVLEYAGASKRPVEGLYWISMFEVFHFARPPYSFFSLILLAGSCLAMGACLLRVFPNRRESAVLGVFFAFLLPPLSNLTFMIHTDNSRISNLLFWISVFFFLKWASKSRSRLGLCLPCAVYLSAALTYENTTLLILTVPAFVLPILSRVKEGDCSKTSPMVRLIVAIVAAFVVFVSMRYLVFAGGAVGHGSLLPPYNLVLSYFAVLAKYLWAPFCNLPGNGWAAGWGVLVGLSVAALLLISGNEAATAVSLPTFERIPGALERAKNPAVSLSLSEHHALYGALLGAAVLILGMLPYLVAGYGATLGFTSQSRIFSSAAFGAAIILGTVLGAPWSNRKLRLIARCVAIALMVVMAVFLADLGSGWREASVKRNEACRSLVEQVPNVKPGTTFLFLDLQWYLSDRAVVFQGVDGLPEFIRILYGRKDLYAYFLYPVSHDVADAQGRTASVSPRGLVARGSSVRGPIPLDSLLVLRRVGSKLVLLDRLSEDRDQVAMDWNGVSVIRSNRDLILKSDKPEQSGLLNGSRMSS